MSREHIIEHMAAQINELKAENERLRRKVNDAAEVAPVVHGEWKLADYGCYCSHCSRQVDDYNRTPICPSCGAKMDGGKQNV